MNQHIKANRIQNLLNFINRSPTPFHAVQEMSDTLASKGFIQLREFEDWSLVPNGRYFLSRNDSSLIAFIVGSKPAFKIIGAHTDSPNLRLKPQAGYAKNGYLQLGVEVYGGVLLSTWMDRDLSLAGRIILAGKKKPSAQLIRFEQSLLRIPHLAIHLNRDVNKKGLLLNEQNHLPPIFSMQTNSSPEEALKKMIARELKCRPVDILGLELSLYDTQPGTIAGAEGEFIFSSRLDNLASNCILRS